MQLIPSTEDSYEEANSYLSLEEVKTYPLNDEESDIKAWFDKLVADNKESTINYYLIQASLYVDGLFAYEGEKTGTIQELQFPRNDETKIKSRVKMACFEVFKSLVSNSFGSNIKRSKIGDLEIERFESEVTGEDVYIIRAKALLEHLSTMMIKIDREV